MTQLQQINSNTALVNTRQVVVATVIYMKKAKTEQKIDNTNCCVPQCSSKGTRNPELSFHKFPSQHIQPLRFKKWILALKMGKPVTKRMKVCSKHFIKSDYFPHNPAQPSQRPRLQRHIVPTMYLPTFSSNSPKKMLPNKKRKEVPQEKDLIKEIPQEEELKKDIPISIIEQELPITEVCDISKLDPSNLKDVELFMNGNVKEFKEQNRRQSIEEEMKEETKYTMHR